MTALVALAALCACGSEDTDPEPLRCDEEDRADEYVAGMTADGESQVFSVTLLESTPAPPDKGDNTWMLEVLDYASATPVDGATITVVPMMPDHGHGTPIKPVITPTGATGQFQVDMVNLWMPGFWEVVVGVDVGGVTDTAKFRFCIEG